CSQEAMTGCSSWEPPTGPQELDEAVLRIGSGPSPTYGCESARATAATQINWNHDAQLSEPGGDHTERQPQTHLREVDAESEGNHQKLNDTVDHCGSAAITKTSRAKSVE
ncbi:unnamed protein product, partial [Lampetra planeri]